ncbi:MAG TPA: peptidoglycan DD-metalloendopeptidase family protein [Rugosibacter sp.]|nr:peptidoglycan DD-metalloendopeptidase family protein [Rugosibacter sp.]HPB90009.1 peptidoglycan DD-metalloendopeptidase family protein [Rugosibacter sp.]
MKIRLFLSVSSVAISTAWLVGCANTAPVPVVDRNASSAVRQEASALPKAPAGMYRVKKGDTLYSIALDHGHDHREIAAWNQLSNANVIQVDQLLRVAPPEADATMVAVAKPVQTEGPIVVRSENQSVAKEGLPAANATNATNVTNISASADGLKRLPKGGKVAYSPEALARAQGSVADKAATSGMPSTVPAAPLLPPLKTGQSSTGMDKNQTATNSEKPAETTAGNAPDKTPGASLNWAWPAAGKVLATFSKGGNKGIDIGGKTGDPVLAAADGVVSYVGTGLRGYGNLVVLRHDATWLSVYAHNSQVLVKEKQAIKRGQKIALMGTSDTATPRLHFEIRQHGKPLDPQQILPAQ